MKVGPGKLKLAEHDRLHVRISDILAAKWSLFSKYYHIPVTAIHETPTSSKTTHLANNRFKIKHGHSWQVSQCWRSRHYHPSRAPADFPALCMWHINAHDDGNIKNESSFYSIGISPHACMQCSVGGSWTNPQKEFLDSLRSFLVEIWATHYDIHSRHIKLLIFF